MAQSIGVSVSDITAETTTAMVSVSANSRNMRPTTPVMNSSGMNTAISDTVSETTVKPISRAPSSAAWNGFLPLSMLRTMFSIITIASSTMKPVPMVSAISDRLSSEKPAAHITAKVAMMESGRLTPAMIVARQLRRNISTTKTTSAAAMTRVSCTSKIEARIVSVRSLTMSSAMPAGRAARSCGSSVFTSSTVAMILAPGCRRTSSTIACSPLCQPPTRAFSSPSTTLATSRSITGAPLRQATMMSLY